ncbi:MAG: 50S ribosomal protein L6 [Flavobacteriales bacterium]|nr:50S ribosomal protein L6 [Bacteroidota bacterium]MCB9241131.1 50S ribosomal protein L6 [Flavobacteriales bacterium]
MSRVGNNPIVIPSGVEVKVNNGEVVVKGPKGELTQPFDTALEVAVEDNQIMVKRQTESKDHKSKHGLYRALINNMVEGVSNGFKVQQELVGVGYKAEVNGQILELNLGYSHNIYLQVPTEISITAETLKGKNPTITMESYDKQLLGQVAAKIRSLRKPEPFKGKGVKFVGEELRRKAGKSAAK